LDSLSTTPPFLSGKGDFVVDDTIGVSLLTYLAFLKNNKSYLIVTSNIYKAQRIYDCLHSFCQDVNTFLVDELMKSTYLTSTKELMANRLFTLDSILSNKKQIVISNIAAISTYLPKSALFLKNILHLKVGEHYNITDLKEVLTSVGYNQVNKIDQSFQYAHRGDILDIFPINYDSPIRIEFFFDEIESIRQFDIANQTSFNNLTHIKILPASEFLLSDSGKTILKERILNRLQMDENLLPYDIYEHEKEIIQNDIDDIFNHNNSVRLNSYYSLIEEESETLFDYCKDYQIILVDYPSLLSSTKLLLDSAFRFQKESFNKGYSLSSVALFHDVSSSLTGIKDNVICTHQLKTDRDSFVFDLKPIPFVATKKEDIPNIIKSYLSIGFEVAISTSNEAMINKVKSILKENEILYENKVSFFFSDDKNKVSLFRSNLKDGFLLDNEKIVILTGKELFNEKTRSGRFSNHFKSGTILKTFEDLTPGDYVVHEYQGIGKYVELSTLEIDGQKKDYLKILYYGNEILYVPLEQFQLVRKYMGKEGGEPRLSHLHTKDWENTKKRIKERINQLADKLFNLYVERSKIEGFAFDCDDEFQKEFEDAFPYDLTNDQLSSLNDIKKDMESPYPMDRLLCGDVGFGKTEVAFRAAFKAILSGKQVAILCPTTLLSRQHYERAVERFSPFDVKIAIFSRLVPEKTQLEYIKGLKDGTIHLAIGTHRLLSKEIVFKDLGLLIVDEEQRFGVEQKERIKELKQNVDVLTLSATPIPRTLQMSLLGVRSLSLINTAPNDRMPIETYVLPYDKDIVKELIERELGRQGQVFYLHNNVSSLYMVSNRLSKMIPSARIGVVHGQMNKDEIEEIMSKFYNGDIDVLVCTSIIENGIDIPNANMIIVEDSNNYGLSQLYQIKGRVGRSDRIAYAYLMYNDNKELTEKAIKRLKALQDFTALGSGYKIAQRDLLIRGAGDILGPDQAGYIDSIGLDMYIKLLNDAVKGKIDKNNLKEEILTDDLSDSTFSLNAYIPDEYVTEENKIELYQEIMSTEKSEDLEGILYKTEDIYGTLPKTAKMLFAKRKIELLLKEAKVKTFKNNNLDVELILKEDYVNINGVGNKIFEMMIPYMSKVKISYTNKTFKIILRKGNDWISDLENILSGLSMIVK